jgi:hypothetical protein
MVNQTTAKATLTQMFNIVFQRMENYAFQLTQLQNEDDEAAREHAQRALAALTRAAAANAAAAAAAASSGAGVGTGNGTRSSSSSPVHANGTGNGTGATAGGGGTPTATATANGTASNGTASDAVAEIVSELVENIAASSGSASASASPTNTPPAAAPVGTDTSFTAGTAPAAAAVSGSAAAVATATTATAAATVAAAAAAAANAALPKGKYGICIVCKRPANHYCIQTTVHAVTFISCAVRFVVFLSNTAPLCAFVFTGSGMWYGLQAVERETSRAVKSFRRRCASTVSVSGSRIGRCVTSSYSNGYRT